MASTTQQALHPPPHPPTHASAHCLLRARTTTLHTHLNQQFALLARHSTRHSGPRHAAVHRVCAGLQPAIILPLACRGGDRKNTHIESGSIGDAQTERSERVASKVVSSQPAWACSPRNLRPSANLHTPWPCRLSARHSPAASKGRAGIRLVPRGSRAAGADGYQHTHHLPCCTYSGTCSIAPKWVSAPANSGTGRTSNAAPAALAHCAQPAPYAGLTHPRTLVLVPACEMAGALPMPHVRLPLACRAAVPAAARWAHCGRMQPSFATMAPPPSPLQGDRHATSRKYKGKQQRQFAYLHTCRHPRTSSAPCRGACPRRTRLQFRKEKAGRAGRCEQRSAHACTPPASCGACCSTQQSDNCPDVFPASLQAHPQRSCQPVPAARTDVFVAGISLARAAAVLLVVAPLPLILVGTR